MAERDTASNGAHGVPHSVGIRLAQVDAEIALCQRCPLSQGRIRTVPGEGAGTALVMFVGEAPGAQEDRDGRPFIGRSGKFLTQTLEAVGLSREDVFITSVVKCRPPKNRDPRPEELAACADYLDRQVALVNPRIIVTLGRFSMARWFPGEKITQIHGQVREIGDGRVALAMFHPAAALRNPAWRTAFEQDMQRLPELIRRVNEESPNL